MECASYVRPLGIRSAPMPWKWATVRAAFLKTRGTRSQAAIAKQAGLRQNAISKLENNSNLGPAVEIFLNAVEGLGLTLSDFFLQLERSQTSALQWTDTLRNTDDLPDPQEARHGGSDSVSAASEQADLRQLRAAFRRLAADLRRMEKRDRERAAARGKKAQTRKGVRPPRAKAS